MPKCINDSTKTYKGNEPSPKGLGFCAHAEPEGMTRQDKNGTLWIVKQYVNGSKKTKRWVRVKHTKKHKTGNTCKKKAHNWKRSKTTKQKTSIATFDKPVVTTNVSHCEHFVVLERKQPHFKLRNELIGKLVDGNQFYEWKKYNCFSDKPRTLRKNVLQAFERKKLSYDVINNTYCGTKRRVDELPFNTSLHDAYRKKIFIQHNGYWISLLCLKKNHAYIFQIKDEDDLIIEREHYESDWLYTKLVFTCRYQKVFEPSDTYSEYSENTMINGYGHTVLLQNNKHQYTYVGAEIYQFTTDDVIEKYYCAEFSNWVPYPVAIGTQYAYFLLDHTRVPMKYMHDIDASEWYNAYSYYYGIEGKKANKLEQYAIQMNDVQVK